MAERNSGEDQDRRPGDDQEDGPGEHQEQDNADDEPAQASSSWERPSSSWERPGARPGNTPAKQPLTEYKKWYNRNRPGKKERLEGAKARGIPLPPGVWPGSDAKGKSSKGKDKGKGKGKEKGKQDKGEQGKGKGQPGKVGGRTPPPPPPRKRPAAALVEPGDSQRPAEEQDYSYYSTEEEGPQAKARIDLVPNPAFLEQIRAGTEARGQGQRQGQVAAPQGPAGEPSSEGSSSDEEDDRPANPGENQDRDVNKRKEPPPRSPTEPATSPREESPSPGEDQEEATQPKPNPSEGTSPPEVSVRSRDTVEVNIGDPHPDPVNPGANQEPQPEEAEKQSAGAREDTGPKEKETSPELVATPRGGDSSSSWAAAREASNQPQALHPEPDYNVTMTFTVQMKKDVNPCHSRYHPQVKVKYTDLEAGDTSLDLLVAGLGGSRIVTQAPHRPGVVWKLSTYPQDPEVKICRVFGAVTPGLIKKAGVHQLWEQGYKAKEDPLWVNLIEMEAMTPLPAELSDTLVIQAMFSVALAAKVVYVRDVGRGNLGLRPPTPEEGGLPVLVFIDVNGWQAYEEGQYPKWPNQAQLSGFWKTIASHNAEMKNELKGLVEQYHTSLEKVTCALKVYAKSRLPEADYTALLRTLVKAQVLALSPEGVLGQPLLPEGYVHDLVPGKTWLIMPFP